MREAIENSCLIFITLASGMRPNISLVENRRPADLSLYRSAGAG